MSTWTYSQDYVGRRPDPPPIPDDLERVSKDKGHATRCRQFLNNVFRYDTIKRTELERAWNRYRLFDMLKQWLQPLRTSVTGQRLWFTWEPMRIGKGQAMFPRPVHNIFSPAIQDEVARLVKVGSKAFIKVDDRDKQEGGVLAKQLLEDRNRKTGWVKQNRTGCYHMAMFGQWIQMSTARVDYVKPTRGPALDAVMCENFHDGCEFALATPDLTGDEAQHLTSRFAGSVQAAAAPFGEDEYGEAGPQMAARCPKCGGNLVEADLPQSYYQKTPDAFGRPLYEDRASFDDVTELVSPFGAFPANQGVGYESAGDMEEIGIRTPRSVPYLKRHYENAKDLKPLFDVQIMAHHPSVSGGWGLTPGQEGLWNNHRLEDLYILKPCYGFERGMLLVMSDDRLLYHGELNLEGTDIPRCNVEWAQWEIRENEIWGKPLAEDMAALQVVVNSSLSQAMDIQQKHASPKVMIHAGMDLNFSGGANSNFPGDVWTLNTRGIPPDLAAKFPHFFGNTGAPDSLFKIFEIAKDHVAQASGAQASEIGAVSGVELNYSALLFAAQKSAERRGPRIHDIRELKIGTWRHRLRLISWGYKTDYLMQFQTDREEWKAKQIRGIHLQDQTDVTLEEEPYVDSGVANRAAIQQGLSYGTIRTSANGGSYAADRKINREIGVPEVLNEDRNIQQDRAHGEWVDYTENGEEPMVDQSSDDHEIHFKDHDLDMKGAEAEKLKDTLVTFPVPELGRPVSGPEYRWPNILRITWSWEKMLTQLLQMSQALETAPEPEKALAIGVPPEQLMQIQAKLMKAQEALGPDWPEALELQIEEVWRRMIESSGLVMIDPLRALVRFNAHRLAHWKLAQAALAARTAAAVAPVAGRPASGAAGLPPGAAPPQSIGAAQAA